MIQDSLEQIVQYFQTSIVFTLEEGPGVLFKALAVFALRDINLSKVIYGKMFSSCKSVSMHDDYKKINTVF